VPDAVPADALSDNIDQYLSTRGAPAATPAPPPATLGPPAAFVCEDDVRVAARAGTRIVVGPRTIVTPAARDVPAADAVLVWLDGVVR
jgi:hypothetical protein